MSNAEELAKYKKLLDDRVITQEDFDKKKEQLLNSNESTGLTTDNTWLVTLLLCFFAGFLGCLLYTSPSPRDQRGSRMPSSA